MNGQIFPSMPPGFGKRPRYRDWLGASTSHPVRGPLASAGEIVVVAFRQSVSHRLSLRLKLAVCLPIVLEYGTQHRGISQFVHPHQVCISVRGAANDF